MLKNVLLENFKMDFLIDSKKINKFFTSIAIVNIYFYNIFIFFQNNLKNHFEM